MFGSLGGPEIILIFIIALLIFGPRKLPEMGKMLGRGLAEFKKAAFDFKRSLESEVEEETKGLKEAKRQLMDTGEELKETFRETAGEFQKRAAGDPENTDKDTTGGHGRAG